MVNASEHGIVTGGFTKALQNLTAYHDDKVVTGDLTESLLHMDDKVTTGIFDEESNFNITKVIDYNRRLSSRVCSFSISIRVPDLLSDSGAFFKYSFICDNVSCDNDTESLYGNSNVSSYVCTPLNTGDVAHGTKALIAMNGPIISGVIEAHDASYEIETHIERNGTNSTVKLYYGYSAAKSEDTEGKHVGISVSNDDDAQTQLPLPKSHSYRSLSERNRSFRGQSNSVVSADVEKTYGQKVRKNDYNSLYKTFALLFPLDGSIINIAFLFDNSTSVS